LKSLIAWKGVSHTKKIVAQNIYLNMATHLKLFFDMVKYKENYFLFCAVIFKYD